MVNVDRTGFCEERMYESKVNWQEDYARIRAMTQMEIRAKSDAFKANFPNTYSYTKRMAEHLLFENNKTGIPLLFLRPSTIGCSA